MSILKARSHDWYIRHTSVTCGHLPGRRNGVLVRILAACPSSTVGKCGTSQRHHNCLCKYRVETCCCVPTTGRFDTPLSLVDICQVVGTACLYKYWPLVLLRLSANVAQVKEINNVCVLIESRLVAFPRLVYA
jgi:hypothetical protein